MTTTTSALLLKHLTVKTRSGFEWLCLCPYHQDSTPSFSINIRKKLFICYACGAKGNMNQLLEHLGVNERIATEEIDMGELTEKIRKASEMSSSTKRPPVGVPVPQLIYTSQAHINDYWEDKRNLSPEAISAYSLGFDVINDEAVIPVRDFNRHNVGIIRRTFDPSRPRYLYSRGMKISEVVFGASEALQLANKNKGRKGVLVITEGSVDAMSAYNLTNVTDNSFYVGVAVLGSRISRDQALIIKKMGFEEIIIATDMDRAGRVAQIQISTMLKDIRCGAIIYNASWNNEEGKDLNSLSVDQIKFVLNMTRDSAGLTWEQVQANQSKSYSKNYRTTNNASLSTNSVSLYDRYIVGNGFKS